MSGPPEPDDDDDDERTVALSRAQWRAGVIGEPELDLLAREEPLEIRINQVAIAVVMRTPGHDEDLVRGFLLSEGVVGHVDDIANLRHCTAVDAPEAEDNVMLVRLAAHVEVDLAAMRRNLYASSSCGVCGKASIEQAMALPRPPAAVSPTPTPTVTISAEQILQMPGQLRAQQEVFEQTGGLHAAGLFEADGRLILAREDVGRHNAVDKVIGAAARSGTELRSCVLMVSGRVSFEIVQKGLALGIPIIAAVSAPTSLAVSLAREAGMGLFGFVRDGRLCVYSGGGRLRP